MKEMAEEEKGRIEEQKVTLGESGLTAKGEELEAATDENEVVVLVLHYLSYQ